MGFEGLERAAGGFGPREVGFGDRGSNGEHY